MPETAIKSGNTLEQIKKNGEMHGYAPLIETIPRAYNHSIVYNTYKNRNPLMLSSEICRQEASTYAFFVHERSIVTLAYSKLAQKKFQVRNVKNSLDTKQ
jgi:hypothetical protein